MFCYKCGKELIKGAIFCAFCGEKQEHFDESQESKKVAATPVVKKTGAASDINKVEKSSVSNVNTGNLPCFSFLGFNIRVSNDRNNYAILRKRFLDHAQASKKRFKENYSVNESLKDVVDYAPGQMYHAIKPVVQDCLNILLHNKVYTINENTFCGKYLSLQSFLIPYNEIEDMYAEIVLDEKSKAEYRQHRKENRGRWVGGGFGIGGAVKGAATAGAMNFASGVGHSFFNGIGNMISSVSASSKMANIFNDPKTYSKLEDGVYMTVISMVDLFALCVSENIGDHSYRKGRVSREDADSANTILDNIPLITEEDSKKEALLKVLTLNPFSERLYEYAFEAFSDKDGELERISEYFGITRIAELKEKCLADYYEKVQTDTEENAIAAKHQIAAMKNEMHYAGESRALAQIEQKLKEFDIEARTAFGFIFETREEADFNRKEMGDLIDKVKTVNVNDMTALRALESELKKKNGKIASDCFGQVTGAINTLDLKLRTVLVEFSAKTKEEIVFENTAVAEAARDYVKVLLIALRKCPESGKQKSHYFKELNALFLADSRRKEIPQVAELFEAYIENFIDDSGDVLSDWRKKALDLYSRLSEKTRNALWISLETDIDGKKIARARKAYLDKLGFSPTEEVLVLFDNTIMGNCSKGFAVTNKGFYSTGCFTHNKEFFLGEGDIKKSCIKVESSDIIIGNKYTDIVIAKTIDGDRIVELIKLYFENVLGSSHSDPVSVHLYPAVGSEESDELIREIRIDQRSIELYDIYDGRGNVLNNLAESIRLGNVLSHAELIAYNLSVAESLSKLDQSSLYLPGCEGFCLSEYYVNEVKKGYLIPCGFTDEEIVLFTLTNSDKKYGITGTSRGLYWCSPSTKTRCFAGLDRNVEIKATDDGIVIAGTELFRFSNKTEEFYKVITELISFNFNKCKELKEYFLKNLQKKLKNGEINSLQYNEKIKCVFIPMANPKTNTRICKKCGKHSSPDFLFCGSCGCRM